MKNKEKQDIIKAITGEIKGNGLREMKDRFKVLTSEFESGNVTESINQFVSAAAFSGAAKVANSPLPVEENTLREFLLKDRIEENDNEKEDSKTVRKQKKNKK